MQDKKIEKRNNTAKRQLLPKDKTKNHAQVTNTRRIDSSEVPPQKSLPVKFVPNQIPDQITPTSAIPKQPKEKQKIKSSSKIPISHRMKRIIANSFKKQPLQNQLRKKIVTQKEKKVEALKTIGETRSAGRVLNKDHMSSKKYSTKELIQLMWALAKNAKKAPKSNEAAPQNIDSVQETLNKIPLEKETLKKKFRANEVSVKSAVDINGKDSARRETSAMKNGSAPSFNVESNPIKQLIDVQNEPRPEETMKFMAEIESAALVCEKTMKEYEGVKGHTKETNYYQLVRTEAPREIKEAQILSPESKNAESISWPGSSILVDSSSSESSIAKADGETDLTTQSSDKTAEWSLISFEV